jgi:hypothetical protein
VVQGREMAWHSCGGREELGCKSVFSVLVGELRMGDGVGEGEGWKGGRCLVWIWGQP